MQKKLIALAVAGLASSAAFAQTNVTVYGVADATFEIVKADGSAVAGNDLASRTRVNSNSSLLGFKGVEDLGNGLKAVFQIESSIALDGTGTSLGTRDTYVGLAGAFGTVVAGNLTGPTRGLGIALDVNAGATGIGANEALLGKLGNITVASGVGVPVTGSTAGLGAYYGNPSITGGASATEASMFDTRWKNAIAYISPSFSGLTAVAAYVSGENKGTTAANGQPNTSGYDLGLTYANGPIYVGGSYNRVTTGNNTAGTVDSAADFRLGGYYKFMPNSRVGLLYDKVKATINGVGDLDQTVWYVSGVVGVGANGRVIAQYGKAGNLKGDAVLNATGLSNTDTGAKHYEVGFEYDLSKRTTAKVLYSRISNDKNSQYDFAIGSVGAVGGVGAGSTVSGLALGLRHTF